MNMKTNYFFFSFLCFFLCLSCTNNYKRKTRFKHNFRQGSADYLYNISDILGDNPVMNNETTPPLPSQDSDISNQNLFKHPDFQPQGAYPKEVKDNNISNLIQIKTAKKGETASISFAQENIYIDPSISFINKYEILDYKILNSNKTNWHKNIAGLLGQVKKFKGFPNTIYHILPVFEGNHLILYKLGPEDKIPYDELPLAKRVGDLLAVPFLGYPVKYCVAEVIPDPINEERETGQYDLDCENIKLHFAKYVVLQERNKKIFKYEQKHDLFPRDFFNLNKNEKNNWYYVRTLVKSPKSEYVGHQIFQPANLVEFHPSDRKLDIVDASGYDIKLEDRLRTLFIPVQWVDFQIKKDSENLHSSFSEELKQDSQSKNLRYFKIDFNNLVNNEVEFQGEKTLKNVFITDDYFSFNVEITSKGSGAYLIKYAFFKKPENSYTPKKWFESDSTEFFPSFAEERRFYKNKAHIHTAEDHDQFLQTTRFNLKEKEIKWHFSKQTPNNKEDQWVREIGHLSIELVNKAFEQAGRDSNHKIKIVLDDTGDDKEVGDVRYNILNLMLPKGKPNRGLLGLGPNVANPITGEVLSATANVWVTNFLNIYTKTIRQYIRFQIYPPAYSLQPFTADMTKQLKEKLYKKAPECSDLPFQPLGVSPFIYEKIEALCPEVTAFINKHKNKGLVYDPENPDLQDTEEIKSCAKKLAFLPIVGVTLHELLHGFAQRHVFSASVDTKNFYEDQEEIKEIFGSLVSDTAKGLFGDFPYIEGTKCHPQPPKYSSVMDYMNLYQPLLFVPGKLDIAALRFIYFDKVDLKNGEVLEVPSGEGQKSILDTETSSPLKKYRVLCGGEKIDKGYKAETNPQQPLCKKFDYGKNPLEITVNKILYFNNRHLMNGRTRYDSLKAHDSIDSAFSSFSESIKALVIKWEQLRDELLKYHDQEIKDFSFLNAQDIQKYQNIIEREKTQNPDFKEYYDMREPTFNYLKRLLFIPSKHCIYKNWRGLGKYQAVSLMKIADELKGDYSKYSQNNKERLINCQSPVVKTWVAEKGELAGEVGFFGTQDIKYYLRPKEKQVKDESSVFVILPSLMRVSSSYSDHHTSYTVNTNNTLLLKMMQEPNFANEYYQEILSYMLEGTDLNSYINPYLIKDSNVFQDLINPNHLSRIVTYKEDKDISLEFSSWSSSGQGLFIKRLILLESAINQLRSYKFRKEFETHFDWEKRKLKDLDLTPSYLTNNSDLPFFDQLYEDYSNQQTDDPISLFIKNHPATLYDDFKHSWIVLPRTDKEENLPARLFRRFNEFKQCIEGTVCENREDKQAYIDSVLNHYHQSIKTNEIDYDME